jgi:hypothetical protein
VSEQTKYLQFKGITKKEEILFKSFLNLIKNELPYQVEVLKAENGDHGAASIVILDEAYSFTEEELNLSQLPSIIVGEDHQSEDSGYITRPVQWSEFKQELLALNVDVSPTEDEAKRVLPDQVDLLVPEEDEVTEEQEESAIPVDDGFSNEGEYEYEIDKMSVDYHSFTNSEYVKVVDDVKQFKKDDETNIAEPVILVTDDESSSVNSVLVIETNSLDAWDFSESEYSISKNITEKEELEWEFQESADEEIILDERAGFEVKADEQYWLEDNEIIIDNRSFMFIKTARKMVYSHTEPGRWPAMLQRRALSKVPLEPDWRPHSGLGVYPVSSLVWVNTLINDTDELVGDLEEDADYLLEKWPKFDLLELDNVLLKLCTMLFVRPESVNSLAEKSGYGKSTIRGLMNACHDAGFLKTPDEIDADKLAPASNDEGMLGRIKDVFR